VRYGMSACLAVGRRGQAPQPRSGASQTPGLRSATDGGIIGSAGSRRSAQLLYRPVRLGGALA